jgi:hypothetical protein
MTVTPDDEHGRSEQHTGDGEVQLDATHDDPVLAVFRTAQWVPPAYREAYLEGAATVLGAEQLRSGR